jgi:hypothetical protein
MAELITDKYIRTALTRPSRHPEVTAPQPVLRPGEGFGDKEFWMYWKCIEKPYTDEFETHKHEFDQYLVFLGGDPRNMLELNGEVEFTLSEDGVNKEVHTITRNTTIFVKAGLYHCPLIFKKVTTPIIFYDLVCTNNYQRKYQKDEKK